MFLKPTGYAGEYLFVFLQTLAMYNPNFYKVQMGKEYMKDARYSLLLKDGTEVLPHQYMRIDFCQDGKHIICEEENGCSLLKLEML